MEDRHAVRSTVVTSQFKIKDWHGLLGDPTLADALLDRLLSRAHRIELKGPSMRSPENHATDQAVAPTTKKREVKG
jgi:DNA replication protein DnaC